MNDDKKIEQKPEPEIKENKKHIKPGDINGKRNGHRLLWSNDGLMFVTYDHYVTFYENI